MVCLEAHFKASFLERHRRPEKPMSRSWRRGQSVEPVVSYSVHLQKQTFENALLVSPCLTRLSTLVKTIVAGKDLDPSKYRENRMAALKKLKDPYPHKWNVTG